MKSIKKGHCQWMILLLFIFSIALSAQTVDSISRHAQIAGLTLPSQSNQELSIIRCLTRSEVDSVNQKILDGNAHKQAYDSTLSVCADLKQEVINNQIVICQSDSVIKAKDDHIAFKTSQAEMLAKDNEKLTKWNTFWRTFAGVATTIVVYDLIRRK
jgi:hypothetical protein